MSIFSGFATRKQEEKYNNCIVHALSLLQDKLIELMSLCKIPRAEQQAYQSFRFDLR